MKIVIVGAGKVGYSLAQRLIQDNHDVYMIDRSPERIQNLENTLDVRFKTHMVIQLLQMKSLKMMLLKYQIITK